MSPLESDWIEIHAPVAYSDDELFEVWVQQPGGSTFEEFKDFCRAERIIP